MRLLSTTIKPPHGWRYTQPQTGFTMTGVSLADVAARVIDHRRANKLEGSQVTKTVMIEIEEQICQKLRGTRELWSFCETTISMPAPAKQVPQKGTVLPCATCLKRRAR